ncbi:unnamed protein product [Schistosoma margrebowiei]|uniref:Uncharacterized protein n=1 Tax=Schistosoma margrebowiei TaxID=48269 RepID=A0A3P7W4E6_9TREM|nr:unnamed protein product [Schistosoma margrebowiei]
MNSSRLYSEKLESHVQDLIGKNSCHPSTESVSFEIDHSEQNTTAVLHSMDNTKPVTVSQSQPPPLKTTGAQPKVDDILLQQTIHTFQALLDERDQEISQLKKHIVQNPSNTELTSDINLPKLYESSIQTELNSEQMEKLSNLKDTLNSGGQLLTSEQYETLNTELNETLKTLTNNPDNCNIPSSEQLSSSTNEKEKSTQNYDDLIQTANKLRKASETIKPISTSSELKPSDIVDQANPNAWLTLESRMHVSFYLGLVSWVYLHLRVDVHSGTRTQYHSLQTPSRHTPSDNGKQELTSRITTSLLEKPESEQQQPSKTRNAASPSTSPIRNLLHRPSSIFGREGNSARSSISDPNKKSGLFNKVEHFFKTNSPKYESVAVGNSTDEAVTTENNENPDQQQTHPTELPKISVSYQSGDFQDNKNHNIKNEIMNKTAVKNNVTESSFNITESTNSGTVSTPIDVTSKPQNSSNATQNDEMLKAKSDSNDKISNPINLPSNSKIAVNNNTTTTHNKSNKISNVVKPDTQPSKKESESKTNSSHEANTSTKTAESMKSNTVNTPNITDTTNSTTKDVQNKKTMPENISTPVKDSSNKNNNTKNSDTHLSTNEPVPSQKETKPTPSVSSKSTDSKTVAETENLPKVSSTDRKTDNKHESEASDKKNVVTAHNESNTNSNVVKPDTQPSKKESESKTNSSHEANTSTKTAESMKSNTVNTPNITDTTNSTTKDVQNKKTMPENISTPVKDSSNKNNNTKNSDTHLSTNEPVPSQKETKPTPSVSSKSTDSKTVAETENLPKVSSTDRKTDNKHEIEASVNDANFSKIKNLRDKQEHPASTIMTDHTNTLDIKSKSNNKPTINDNKQNHDNVISSEQPANNNINKSDHLKLSKITLRRDTVVLENPKSLLPTTSDINIDNSQKETANDKLKNPTNESVSRLITDIEQLRNELCKFPASINHTKVSIASQTNQQNMLNCSTQTCLDKTIPSTVDCVQNQLENNTFQLQLESLILYSIKYDINFSKNNSSTKVMQYPLQMKKTPYLTRSKVLEYSSTLKETNTSFMYNTCPQQSINHLYEFASSLFHSLQKEYVKNFNKLSYSNLNDLNLFTLTQFILQTYDIWNYDLNSENYSSNTNSIRLKRNSTTTNNNNLNQLSIIKTPLHYKINIRQFCNNLLLCIICIYMDTEQLSPRQHYTRIISFIKKLMIHYLHHTNNTNNNDYFFNEFNKFCNEKLLHNHLWFSQIIYESLILLQPFHIEWIHSCIDLINLSNHTLQKIKYRLTTNITIILSNIQLNKNSIFEFIPSTMIDSLCRTNEMYNLIYLRILYTNLLLTPMNLTFIIKIYNSFIDANNYLLSLTNYTTTTTTLLYKNINEPIIDLNYIISQLLQLFIQLKYHIWEIIIQPIVNNHQNTLILDQLLNCINPKVIKHFNTICSNTNHHSNIYLFILIFRILMSVQFELDCLIHESKSINSPIYGFNYSIIMSSLTNCSITGPSKTDHILCEDNETYNYLLYHIYEMCYSEWLITGLWPYNKVKMFNDHHHHHSQKLSVQYLWFHALKQKDELMTLLFHNCLINNFKSGLQQFVKQKSINIKLWLPVKFNSTDLNNGTFWSRVYLAAIMQWYDTNPKSTNCGTIISKLSSILNMNSSTTSNKRTNYMNINNYNKSCPRVFLRKLEEVRCNWSYSSYVNYDLMYIWCLMSDDIHCCSISGNVYKGSDNINNADLYHPSIIFEKNLNMLPDNVVTQLKLAYFIEPSILFTAISHKTVSEYILKYRQQLANTKCSYSENNVDQKLVENLRCQIESLKEEIKRLQRGASTAEERTVNGNTGEFHTSHSSPSHFYSMDPYGSVDKQNEEKSYSLHNPSYYSAQLQELRQTGDLELVRAHLSLSERRRRELERRITELTDELARSRAEARSAETSLSAARRTEAALRRRLLVAMDSRGSPNGNYEMNISRNSHEFSTNEGSEMMNALELQADIIKLQATNASLTEAALLDRTRLHDQAMRIDQLESEHKALLDRVSCLQAAETGAQRGIVRLQALYEDMLREYSESKPLELSNVRGRHHQRSSSRNSRNNDFITNGNYNEKYRATSRNNDVRATEQQISEVQAMNSPRKRSIYENSGEIVAASSTTVSYHIITFCHMD